MAIKEFAVKQASKQVIPMLGKMSDKNLGRLFSLGKTLAPTDFTRSFIESMDQLRQKRHPVIETFRRTINCCSPHVRNTLVNNLLVKSFMQGAVRREKVRSEGTRVPGTFLISPTMRCNLRCTGCYAGNYSMKDDLEFEVIDRLLSEGKELGIYWVTILGGEPFIRHDMWEIYKKHNDIAFQIYTNGTLVEKDAAKKLEEVGNVLVVFSLEGFEEETDARRGKGTFQRIMQGMENLREVGVPFGFSSMVTRHNVDTIISDEFTDMLVERGCILGWHFLYIPVGLDADTSLMPTPEQRDLLRVHGAQRIRNEKPIFVVDFWNDSPYAGGCIAGGAGFFHVNSRGDVEPCIFIHMATDNIHDKSLKAAIGSPFFGSFRDRQPYSKNLLRPCTIIDHPQVLRDIDKECQPYPTDGPMCGLISAPVDGALDEYSQKVGPMLDKAWQQEFASGQSNSMFPESVSKEKRGGRADSKVRNPV